MTPSTMLRRSTALFACVSALALPASGVAQTFTITRTSSPVLYLDLSSSLQGMYVSYQITNTGAPAGDVWTEITAFSGGVITLAANEDGLVHLGAIGTGESKAAFFYLQASGGTTVNQSHTVNVYTTKPPGTPLASQGFNLTSEQTIKANANKVLTTVVGPNPPTLGGIVTITVTGETGTIGAAKILTFTPATYVDWRADAYELLSTEITLSGANSGIFVDELLIPPDSITSTANTAYTAVYTFRAVGTTSAPTAVSPVGYISSGTQVKHTNTNDFGALEPVQPADNKLEVTKSANPTWFASGGTVTYTLTLRNTSTTDSASVDDFTDYLPTSPATVTYVPSSSTWKGSSIPDPVGTTTLSWYGTFTVQPSDSAKLVFQAAVPATEGAYTNSAVGHVSGEQIDTTLDTSDDSKATADVVVGGADIEVTKTGPASVTALDTITYLITTTNNGDQDADQVVVTDSLPSGMTFVSASRSASESGGEVTWPAIATLSNGSSVTDTVIVVAPASGPLENVAKVSSTTADPDATNNRSTVSTSVTEQADLEVVKTGPASVLANDTVTYVITTANNGPSTATNVTVTDTLPSGVTFVSATNGGAYTEPDSVVTWTIASLANGASQVDTVKVLAPASGTLDNLAAATSDTGDPDATNDTSFATTSVGEQADIEVTKTGPVSALVGDTLTYVITTVNNGPSDAQGVVVSDLLPGGVIFVSATRGASESGGVVTWPALPSLVSGASVIDTVKIVAAAPGSLVDIASAAATTSDPDDSNNDGSASEARVTTTVGEQADIQVVKSGPASVLPGDTITYVITFTNNGPSSASDVVLTDPLPTGVSYLRSSRGATESGDVVTWPAYATLAVDESFTDTLEVLAPSSGPIENAATATAATSDPDTDNNTGRHTTTILQPDLALTKESTGDFEVGEPGSYIMTVTNEGPISTIGPITLADTLPAGLTYNSHAGDGWDCTVAAEIVTCTYPAALAAGASTSLTLTVDVGAAAVPGVTNRAVVSTEGDSDGDDDASSTTTTVASAAQLFLDKTASRGDVAIGDFVDYSVRVQNVDNDPATDVEVQDSLPAGFTYERGSARVDGVPIGDPVGSPGPHLVFDIGVIPAGETVTLTYRVEVGAGASTGDGVNRAVAWSPALGAFSNEGKAKVMLRDDVFGDEGIIAGKIFVHYVDDIGGIGVPGVRVYLEDGTSAVTDAEGKYHFTGISPRLHVVRVDESTLPAGAELVVLSNRHAWDARSLFVDLKKGELHRADFAIAATPEVLQAVSVRQQRGDPNAAILEGSGVASEEDIAEPDFAEGTEEWTFYRLLPDSTLNEMTSALPVLRPRDPDGIDPLSEGALRIWVPEIAMPADGLTHVPVRVRLEPVGREQVPSRTTITLETSLGRWDVVDENPRLSGVQATLEGGNGEFMLVAPAQADTGLVRVTAGGYSDRAQLAFRPARRGLFFAGVVDARVELRSLALSELGAATRRDRFEDELNELAVDSDDGRFRAETRAGLFLNGEVLRDYLVTVHFDSEADGRSRLFRDIRPDELYPIYGDASIQGFDAQSTSRFYARVDRERSSLLYGDFITPPATGERQLGAYYRSLTGVLGHVEKNRFTVNAFASRGDDRQVIDEIPGQGISGPYQLSRPDGLINSERVEIITRDRNQPAVILKAEPQARFADYTLEPLSGRLVFRQPVPSLDSNLNPISIRVTYEVEQGGQEFWVYGADAQGRAADRIELGGSLVRDDNPAGTQEVYSANATLKLRDDLFLVGEYAWSDSANMSSGDGMRLEVRHVTQRLQARAFFLDTDTSFANRSSALGRGRRELGLRADGLFDEKTRLFGEFIRTEDLFTNGTRWGLQAAATRRMSDWLDLEVGYRHSEESAAPASGTTAGATPYTTNTLRARMTGRLLSQERVSLFGEWEQDLGNLDRHRGMLGGDYRFSGRGRLYAQHELISSLAGPYALNSTQTQNNTVIGLEAEYLKNTQVFSEYRLRDAFNGRESHAAIGLRNRWAMAPGLRLDTSLERVAPLTGSGGNAFSVTGALEYTAHPDIKGTARLEYRTGGLGNQWFGSLGYAHKLNDDVALLFRSALSWMIDTRLYERTQLGLAFRQDEVNRWNALLRYEHKYDRDESVADLARRRQAHILSGHVNFRVTSPLILSSQLAGKWVGDASQGLESSTNAYLLGLRGLYDISPRFDAVVNIRGLASGSFDSRQFGFGAELGYILMRNLRVAAGYNVFGFRDQDLAGANYTDHGFYLQVGYKFDEYTFGKKTRRDTDGDGVIDELDLCPNTPPGEEVDAHGCTLPKDRDGDGIFDQFDVCPGTPLGEQVDARGCPLPKDADADGVIDSLDRCPGTPLGEEVDLSGCPLPKDSDGDGILDPDDECPETPANEEVNERGCPALFVAGATTLTLEGVNFEFDRSDLTPESLPILDRVAELLLANPDVRVEVAGHTDIRGSHAYNMWLSMARANSVRDYLISRGVAAERMEAAGYGPDEPIDTNDTAEGRARNRRVELRRID